MGERANRAGSSGHRGGRGGYRGGRGGGHNNGFRTKLTCFLCGEEGHMVAKCLKNKVAGAPSANKAEEGKEAETAEKAGNASHVHHAFGTSATIVLTGIQTWGPLLIRPLIDIGSKPTPKCQKWLGWLIVL